MRIPAATLVIVSALVAGTASAGLAVAHSGSLGGEVSARNMAQPTATIAKNFTVLGHSRLGADIQQFADVWGHGDYAYVGTGCGDDRSGGDGVQVVDLSVPSRPRVVGTLPNPRYSRAEDVVVRHVSTPDFTGDLAAVGVQGCFGSGHEDTTQTGMRFYDVTQPEQPRLLGRFDLPMGAVGCHEIDLVQPDPGKVLAACARNLGDHFASDGETAVQFVDASNPRFPRRQSTFSLRLQPDRGYGCLPFLFAHSVRFIEHGSAAYVSYWDAGTVRVDLTDPTAPRATSRIRIRPPDEDGDNHSMTLARHGNWAVINSEDTSPSDCGSGFGGYGEAYVYNIADKRHPYYVGSFATPDTHSTRTDGTYTVHNTEVLRDNQFISSWYSDGVVWWSMNRQGVSRQRGRFIPPASTSLGFPLVWGVYVNHSRGYILVSDEGNGLWIVRPSSP